MQIGTGVKYLIVNADDLGWTEGVNQGIAEAHRNGIVTSASLLANGIAFESAVALARITPRLGVGVHLNLSDGEPTAPREKVPSLLDNQGRFSGGPKSLLVRIARHALNLEEVMVEWNAQIEKALAAGFTPTHLDGHKHVHMLPGLFDVTLRLAKRHGIRSVRISHENSNLRAALAAKKSENPSVDEQQPAAPITNSTPSHRAGPLLARMFPSVGARALQLLVPDAQQRAQRAGIATSDYFCGIAQTGELTKVGVARLLKSLPTGMTEFMCHPGYVDEELKASPTRLRDSREREVAILMDSEIRNLVASEGIRLIDYGFVSREAVSSVTVP